MCFLAGVLRLVGEMDRSGRKGTVGGSGRRTLSSSRQETKVALRRGAAVDQDFVLSSWKVATLHQQWEH